MHIILNNFRKVAKNNANGLQVIMYIHAVLVYSLMEITKHDGGQKLFFFHR